MYELPHQLLNDLKFRIFGNEGISRKLKAAWCPVSPPETKIQQQCCETKKIIIELSKESFTLLNFVILCQIFLTNCKYANLQSSGSLIFLFIINLNVLCICFCVYALHMLSFTAVSITVQPIAKKVIFYLLRHELNFH